MLLSVLTLNLWHDAGPWPARAERIREWIGRLDPDLVGFQEALRGEGFDHLAWKFRHGALRERQVQAVCDLVLRRRPRGGLPPILVGDFNAEPESAEIRYVTGLQSLGGRSMALLDAWRVAGEGGDGVTWSNRNPYAAEALEPDRRIDYVFAGFPQRGTAISRIERCAVVCDDAHDDVWPSDHFGVYAELRTAARAGREAA